MIIDIVIPWVDGHDTVWQKKKDKYDTNGEKTFDNSDMRFRDWGTLKYVFRSIEKNLPWYNKIFLITEGHFPEWLDINHEKIKLITHEELYFDKSHLPVFSSPSIEMNLLNIKELSENFLYFNDDTLVIKKLDQSRFFIDNQPVDFLSHGWFPRNKLFEKLRGMNSWAHSIKNDLELINKKFAPLQLNRDILYHNSYSLKTKLSNFLLDKCYKRFIWVEHWHHPQAYKKSTLREVYKEYSNEMMMCSKNRFRDNSDLNQYIYRYWQLASGSFYPYMHNDAKYCKIEKKEDIDKCLENIEKYAFFCPNDSLSEDVSDDELSYISSTLIDKLDELFPDKASFER